MINAPDMQALRTAHESPQSLIDFLNHYFPAAWRHDRVPASRYPDGVCCSALFGRVLVKVTFFAVYGCALDFTPGSLSAGFYHHVEEFPQDLIEAVREISTKEPLMVLPEWARRFYVKNNRPRYYF